MRPHLFDALDVTFRETLHLALDTQSASQDILQF